MVKKHYLLLSQMLLFTLFRGICNMFPNPCSKKLINLTAKSGERILSKPSFNEKKHDTVEIIEKHFNSFFICLF